MRTQDFFLLFSCSSFLFAGNYFRDVEAERILPSPYKNGKAIIQLSPYKHITKATKKVQKKKEAENKKIVLATNKAAEENQHIGITQPYPEPFYMSEEQIRQVEKEIEMLKKDIERDAEWEEQYMQTLQKENNSKKRKQNKFFFGLF